jgi:hypothetical protein
MTHDPIADAAKVIPFPVKKLTFDPVNIDSAKALSHYDRDRTALSICLNLLQLSPAHLKAKVCAIEASCETGDDVTQRLISDLESCAEDFAARGEAFRAVAARLIAVHHTLI